LCPGWGLFSRSVTFNSLFDYYNCLLSCGNRGFWMSSAGFDSGSLRN
jgi:hypothetical protein